jgi:hypothetical protein
MLFKEIIAANSENYMNPINTLIGQNAQIWIFEVGGTFYGKISSGRNILSPKSEMT